MAQPISATSFLKVLDRDLRAITRDRLELVERAAGVAQPPARDHRHIGPASGQRRRQHQRDAIAHAARGMLVEHRPVEIPAQHCPLSRIARVNCTRPADPSPRVQTAMAKALRLRVGHVARGQTFGEPDTARPRVGGRYRPSGGSLA